MPHFIQKICYSLFLAVIMGRHKFRPLAILAKNLGSHDAVIGADKFNDVLVFRHGRLVKIRPFGVQGKHLARCIQLALIVPEIRHH